MYYEKYVWNAKRFKVLLSRHCTDIYSPYRLPSTQPQPTFLSENPINKEKELKTFKLLEQLMRY